MAVRDLENLMKQDIENVFNEILREKNYLLDVRSEARSGAEISACLEDEIVAYIARSPHERISNVNSSHDKSTKAPYDFRFNYKCEDENFSDLIWADIKAIKNSTRNSTPDLGTPEKIIKFINDGHFYLMFVVFKYEPVENNQTRFLRFEDGKYVHCWFLKDINHSVSINTKPQFGVEIHKEDEYRTRDEFIDLFQEKYRESLKSAIARFQEKLEDLDDRFDEVREKMAEYNRHN